MNIKNDPSTPSFALSDSQINDLARPLIDIVIEFYKDPRNERAFQEWLEQQKSDAIK